MAEQSGSGLLEIPDFANARGLREVGCIPDAGPGFAEVVEGKGTDGIREGLESGEISSLLLFGADPLRDFPNTGSWKSSLAAADHLIVFSTFENETTAMADLVLPLETHAEKDGTVTHPDGRLQRVRPSASRPGNIRPNWGVMAEISIALGHDTGVVSQPSAFDALTGSVSFYAGITDDEIGGRGVRWQERDAAESLPRPEEEGPRVAVRGEADDHEGPFALGTYRDLWAGPITELNPPLRFLRPRQRIELSPADAERLGVEHDDLVRVGENGTSVTARVAIRERVAEGACFLIEGTAEDNANAITDGGPRNVEITKVGK
jgi:NADH-quinone oxidoreductase subunit G